VVPTYRHPQISPPISIHEYPLSLAYAARMSLKCLKCSGELSPGKTASSSTTDYGEVLLFKTHHAVNFTSIFPRGG